MGSDSITTELLRIEEAGLYRKLRLVESEQGPTLRLDGREVINFSSNPGVVCCLAFVLGRGVNSMKRFRPRNFGVCSGTAISWQSRITRFITSNPMS